jgi:hypothetical protein
VNQPGGLRQVMAQRGQRRKSDERAMQYKQVAQAMRQRRQQTLTNRQRRSVY